MSLPALVPLPPSIPASARSPQSTRKGVEDHPISQPPDPLPIALAEASLRPGTTAVSTQARSIGPKRGSDLITDGRDEKPLLSKKLRSTKGMREEEGGNDPPFPIGSIIRIIEVYEQDSKYGGVVDDRFEIVGIAGKSALVVYEVIPLDFERDQRRVVYRRREGELGFPLAFKVYKKESNPSDTLKSEMSINKLLRLLHAGRFQKKKDDPKTHRPQGIVPSLLYASIALASAQKARSATESWDTGLYEGLLSPLHRPFEKTIPTLSPAKLLSYFESAFEAINNLHSCKWVHRDIKNENFVIELKREIIDGKQVETETGRLLMIDVGTAVKLGMEEKIFSKKDQTSNAVSAAGTYSHMSIASTIWLITDQFELCHHSNPNMQMTWKDKTTTFRDQMMSHRSTVVLREIDLWSFGICILRAADRNYFDKVCINNVVVERILKMMPEEGPVEDYTTVVKAVNSLGAYYSPIYDTRMYEFRLDKNGIPLPGRGRVDNAIFGDLLSKLLLRPSLPESCLTYLREEDSIVTQNIHDAFSAAGSLSFRSSSGTPNPMQAKQTVFSPLIPGNPSSPGLIPENERSPAESIQAGPMPIANTRSHSRRARSITTSSLPTDASSHRPSKVLSRERQSVSSGSSKIVDELQKQSYSTIYAEARCTYDPEVFTARIELPSSQSGPRIIRKVAFRCPLPNCRNNSNAKPGVVVKYRIEEIRQHILSKQCSSFRDDQDICSHLVEVGVDGAEMVWKVGT